VKVALITGVCPSGMCGVGDYTICLANALNAGGVETHVIASGDWSLRGVFKVNRSLRQQNFDVVHIEYPTLGFGYKLGPQGLSLLQGCVVTIHEASQRRILRQLSLLPFTIRPEHIVFTSRFERQFATTWAPWILRVSSVIPVGSNIGVGASKGPRALNEIVYFGLIMPLKGLERVVELSRLIRSAGLSLTVRIIGTAPPRHTEYLERLRSETTHLPIIWDLDLSDIQIAERLGEASIAYLPYPDGASERRTTLKAALLNGVAVLTTSSAQTPHNLGRVVRFCQSAEEALAAIRHLISHTEEIVRMASAAAHSAKKYSWERIAELHLRVYQRVLSQKVIHGQIHSDRAQLETRGAAESDASN
jgi:glycosyltransferase involved in cell wall biosynthesis